MNVKEERLTISDWLSFLETRSSNYIAAISIGISAVAIVVSILGFKANLEIYQILIILILALLVLKILTSWMIGSSLLVEAMEAKRIADEITEGKLKTVAKIEERWRNRKKSFRSWLLRD